MHHHKPLAKRNAVLIAKKDANSVQNGQILKEPVSSTHRTLTTSGKTFPVSRVVGAPLAIVNGRGKRQVRLISSVSGQTITVNPPWHIRPDSTSVFQIGGFGWSWKSGWSSWLQTDRQNVRNVNVLYHPTQVAATMDMRIYDQYSETPTAWAVNWPRNTEESSGLTTFEDDPDALLDLTKPASGIYIALDNWGRQDEYGADNIAVELRGHSCKDRIALYQIDIEGAEKL